MDLLDEKQPIWVVNAYLWDHLNEFSKACGNVAQQGSDFPSE